MFILQRLRKKGNDTKKCGGNAKAVGICTVTDCSEELRIRWMKCITSGPSICTICFYKFQREYELSISFAQKHN